MERRSTGFLLIGAALLIVGLFVLLVGRNDTVRFTGYGDMQFPASLVLITPRSFLGYLISTAGGLLMAGGLGYRLGHRSAGGK